MSRRRLNPYVPYIGKKTHLVPLIRDFYWEFFPNSHFVDAFCGSGSMTFGVNPQRATLLDGNPLLIRMHQAIKEQNFYLIQHDFEPNEYEQFKKWFFEKREEINTGKWSDDEGEEASVFFALLNYGFNGICRGSRKKKISIPPGSRFFEGKHAPPLFPDKTAKAIFENVGFMQSWNFKLVQFSEKNYFGDIPEITKDSFLYCDPPYVQKDNSLPHRYYPEGKFPLTMQSSLAEYVAGLECPAIISNAKIPDIVDLYQQLGLIVFETSRSGKINSDTSSRKKQPAEVLALNDKLADTKYIEYFLKTLKRLDMQQ